MAGLTGHHQLAIIIKMMNKATGKKARNSKENARIFAEHFEKNVFNRTVDSAYDPNILNEIDDIPTINSLAKPPSPEEIAKAITKMKNGKAPGENGVPPDAYKL